MAQRGGKRTGSGRPKGSRDAQTVANETAVKASQQLTAEVVLEQILRGATFDLRRLVDAKGNYKPLHKLTAEEAFCIESVELVRGNVNKGDEKFDDVVRIRTIKRKDYVELAAKYHGLLVERVKIEDDKPLRTKVALARQRLAAEREKKR